MLNEQKTFQAFAINVNCDELESDAVCVKSDARTRGVLRRLLSKAKRGYSTEAQDEDSNLIGELEGLFNATRSRVEARSESCGECLD
jgi:hypothetical protein